MNSKFLFRNKIFNFISYNKNYKKKLLKNTKIVNNIKFTIKFLPFLKSVGLFFPINHEPDIRSLIDDKNIYCMPKIFNKNMLFVKYNNHDLLEKTKFQNLLQPVSKCYIIPKLIFIPGLAFSVDGYRLGYGLGYYDKYLFKIKKYKICKIGVCFNEYLFTSLPYENHDLKVDYIITDKVIIKV